MSDLTFSRDAISVLTTPFFCLHSLSSQDDSATAVSLLGALEALDIGGAVGVHGCSDPAAFFTQIESKVSE